MKVLYIHGFLARLVLGFVASGAYSVESWFEVWVCRALVFATASCHHFLP